MENVGLSKDQKMTELKIEQSRFSRRALLSGTAAIGAGLVLAKGATSPPHAASLTQEEIGALSRVTQEMVRPPFLPKHDQVATGDPKVVEVRFEIEEKKMIVDDDDTEIWTLTFNGWVPGPMIVVHEGDYIELTLVNPESSLMEHNIDFHASTGALGGGELTLVSPGEEVIFRFQGHKAWRLCVSLRPWRRDGPLPRHPRDEWRNYGAAARWSEGQRRQIHSL